MKLGCLGAKLYSKNIKIKKSRQKQSHLRSLHAVQGVLVVHPSQQGPGVANIKHPSHIFLTNTPPMMLKPSVMWKKIILDFTKDFVFDCFIFIKVIFS